MATKYTFTVRFLKNFFGPITVAMALALTACTSERNSDGGVISIDEKEQTPNANENNNQINIDSLVDVLRNQITTPTTPYIDSSYKNTINNDEAWKDSARRAFLDSLKAAHNDSLYMNPIDTSLNEQSLNATRTLFAEDDGVDDVYGAFANQYALMYENISFTDPDNIDDTITIHSPFPISITNECSKIEDLCSKKKVKVKTWISGFTDTTTITASINPVDSIVLFPNFTFDNTALLSVTSAQKAQRQIEVYALENDQEIQFYSATKPITIHPMQVFGAEILFYLDSIIRYPWYSVWITPMADSITNIVDEVAKKLPDGRLLVYQYYFPELSMEINSKLVVEAVFEVLQSRDIKYVQNTGAASIGQRINYPVETLRKKQGICIETATLFASVLERIGFETFLIITSDHAFVGWHTESNGNTIDLVETTMIGDKNATFLDANYVGIEEYNEQQELGNFDSYSSVVISIEKVREMGILPNNIP